MHKRLLSDLDFRAADNMPDLPPKRMLFNRDADFIQDRQRLLNKYLKFIILIFEAIESPILQRFLEIDTQFDPKAEYQYIDVEKKSLARSDTDCSSLFLEMDKFMKVRLLHVMRNQTGPIRVAGIPFNQINST